MHVKLAEVQFVDLENAIQMIKSDKNLAFYSGKFS